MNPLSSVGQQPVTTSTLDTLSGLGSTGPQNPLKGISLTIVAGPDGIEGPGGEIRIRLESPIIGPEDIPLNECLQQLESLPGMPLKVFTLAGGLHELAGIVGDFGTSLKESRTSGEPLDLPRIAQVAEGMARQAEFIEISIRDMIESSTYPNFSDFLKELVKISQELRETATKAKMAAIEANYETLMDAADQMVIAAGKAKESRDLEIEASRIEAIGKIVTGTFSIICSAAGGLTGAGQLGSAVGQAGTQIIGGSLSLAALNLKSDASVAQLQSDLANVARTRLEAAAKLIESQIQIAEDIRETAKSLRDMILKIYQDFIASQSQTLQRANV